MAVFVCLELIICHLFIFPEQSGPTATLSNSQRTGDQKMVWNLRWPRGTNTRPSQDR